MTEKKNEAAPAPKQQAACSPPSHPTTLGNVWTGETRPSLSTVAALINGPSFETSEKPRNE